MAHNIIKQNMFSFYFCPAPIYKNKVRFPSFVASATKTPKTNNLTYNNNLKKLCTKKILNHLPASLLPSCSSLQIVPPSWIYKKSRICKKSWICKKILDLQKISDLQKESRICKKILVLKRSRFSNRAQYIKFKLNILNW